MSGKGSKRRHRRINTNDEEVEKKVEEIVDQSDDNKSTISTEEKDTLPKEENGEKELKDSPKQEVKENGQNDLTKDIPTIEIIPPTPEVEKTNGQASNNETAQLDNFSDTEPLVPDAEDPELDLPSETNSDQSSEVDKSPVLHRCKTRRSQTRSVPTPKTPKSLDSNAEDSCKAITNEVRVNITRLQSESETIAEVESSESVSVVSNDTSVESVLADKIQESDLTLASVFVNLGNDTSRNMDFTSNYDDQTVNASNFIEITKDKTYGETLRCLTGRKALRSNPDYKTRLYHSNIEITSKNDSVDGSNKYLPEFSNRKRKLDIESPEEQKRAKLEDSNSGFFSYIASPFKSKVGRTEIPSSTPKLTSFKYVHQSTVLEDVQYQDNLNEKQNNVDSKKWCAIM